jgi:hypothetical protein
MLVMALNQGVSVLIDERIAGEVAAVGGGDSMEACSEPPLDETVWEA